MRKRERVFAQKGGVMKTKQAPRDGCNVNLIVERWRQTGVPPMPRGTPNYGDFSGAGDYHTAMNKVRDAERDFMELPSAVRRHCDDDAGEFLRLVNDPKRRGELEELGLIPERAPVGAPEAVPVAKVEESKEVIPPAN